MQSKEEIRRAIGSILPAPPDLRAERSARLCEAIAAFPQWQTARSVAFFAPQPREPDIEMLWAHAGERSICYPRVEGDQIGLYQVGTLYELRAGRWGLREPDADPARAVPLHKVELILVPGVAFTRDGRRLGRGGGYYDRLLAGLAAGTCKIGVCFEHQVVPELPVEPHDQSVDFVATENGIVSAN